MFDRYSDRARQTIFWARYEAGAVGAATIAPEHLLVGLLRTAPELFGTESRRPELDTLRAAVKERTSVGDPLPTSQDMPLSPEGKLTLERADAVSSGSRYLRTEHLLLALLTPSPTPVTQLLSNHGVPEAELLAKVVAIPESEPEHARAVDPDFFQRYIAYSS